LKQFYFACPADASRTGFAVSILFRNIAINSFASLKAISTFSLVMTGFSIIILRLIPDSRISLFPARPGHPGGLISYLSLPPLNDNVFAGLLPADRDFVKAMCVGKSEACLTTSFRRAIS